MKKGRRLCMGTKTKQNNKRQSAQKPVQRCLNGSLTVEAALVMSALLLFIGSLLTGIFGIHSRVVGNMVLQTALECGVYREDDQSIAALESGALQDYRGYFWCGGGSLVLEEEGEWITGTVRNKSETEISVKTFEPENFLRLLRAAGV